MLSQFLQVFRGYAWYEIAIEMAIIWVCVFAIYRSLRGTRGAGIIKGVALVLVVLTLVLGVLGGSTESFGGIRFISSEILGLLAIVLAVVFQPELRQAMIRVGQTRLFNRQPANARNVATSVGEAVEYLAKNRFGSLVVIERQTGLGGLIEGGVELDAKVSSACSRRSSIPTVRCTTSRWSSAATGSSRPACSCRCLKAACPSRRSSARGTARRWGSRRRAMRSS